MMSSQYYSLLLNWHVPKRLWPAGELASRPLKNVASASRLERLDIILRYRHLNLRMTTCEDNSMPDGAEAKFQKGNLPDEVVYC